ncbi:MAG: pyridoxal-phosphate-dependent aminotransferase family protein, partial [Dehalococcoidia bacterium]
MTKSYLDEFQPPQTILLGPGPSSVHPRVLQAMTLPVLGHLDPRFFRVMDEVCEMLRKVYRTSNTMTVPLSSTGTGAMEAACANILEPGDAMVVCRNGYFGDRLADIAQRCGAETFILDTPWGQSVKLPDLADELDKHPRIKAVGVVHAETSTGVLTPLPDIIKLIHDHDALAIVDAVTSLGGHELQMDEWDIDVCYSGT